jgi:hypothetical protein
MVVGINHDWAYCDSGVSRMYLAAPSARETRFRSF